MILKIKVCSTHFISNLTAQENYFQGVHGLLEYSDHTRSTLFHKLKGLYPRGLITYAQHESNWKISSSPFLDRVFSLSL